MIDIGSRLNTARSLQSNGRRFTRTSGEANSYFFFPLTSTGRWEGTERRPLTQWAARELMMKMRSHKSEGFDIFYLPVRQNDVWFILCDPKWSWLDHDDPSKPSHRLTNGPEPSKTIESDGRKIKKTSKNHWWQWSDRQKTFNGNGRLKNHWKIPMVSSKPLKRSMLS